MTSLNVPQDLEVSFHLFKQCKLWVWDFDDTLINTSVYLKKDMSPNAILNRCDSSLDEDIPQWRYFRKLVEFLVMHGRYVGIASFGTYEIIQAYMKRVMGFNQQFFTKKNIIAPELKDRDVYRFNVPPNKNEYVYTLMQIYRVQDFNRVVLFDDKPSNISDAIAIGIVAVQIPTIGNGDKPGGQMLFGPWIMTEFDKKIKHKCDNYLNRDTVGIYDDVQIRENMQSSNAYASKPKAFGSPDIQNIDFGTGIQATDNLQNSYNLGVDDSSIFNKSVAFGTGIGDRKVLKQPQFRWNGYKNSPKNTPKWYNGNYVNVPGLVNTEGYWNEEDTLGSETLTLGGTTMSYWDTHQKIRKTPSDSSQNIDIDTVSGINEGFTSYSNWDGNGYNNVNGYNNGNKSNNKILVNSGTGFGNGECNCKYEWNWIILILLLLIVVMSVIVIM